MILLLLAVGQELIKVKKWFSPWFFCQNKLNHRWMETQTIHITLKVKDYEAVYWSI